MNLMTDSKRQCRRDDDRIDDMISILFDEERIRKDLATFYKYTSHSRQGDEWRLYTNLTSMRRNINATSNSTNEDADDTYDFPYKDSIPSIDEPLSTVPLIHFDIDADIAVGDYLKSHFQQSKYIYGDIGEDYSVHSLDVQIDEDDEGWTETEEGDETFWRNHTSSIIRGNPLVSRYSENQGHLLPSPIPAFQTELGKPIPNSTISALVAARKMTLVGLRNASSSTYVTSSRRSVGSSEPGIFSQTKDKLQNSSWKTQSTLNSTDVSENIIPLAKILHDETVPRPCSSRSIAVLKARKRKMEKMMMAASST